VNLLQRNVPEREEEVIGAVEIGMFGLMSGISGVNYVAV